MPRWVIDMTVRVMSQRLFASIALLFLPLTAWSKDASVVTLVAAAISICHLPGVLSQIRQSLPLRSPVVICGLLFCAWMAASLIWAPASALAALAKAYAVIALAIFLSVAITCLSHSQRTALIKPLATSCGALVIILVVERLTGGFFIALDRSSETPEQLLNAMNGGLVLLAAVSFCAAAVMYRVTGDARRIALVGIFVLVLTMTFRMDAVPVALFAGGVAAVAALNAGRSVVIGLLVLIGAGALMWPLAAWLAAEAGLDVWIAENVHPNWGHRIAIWGAVSELVADKSLLGYGFNAARLVGQTADLMPDPQGRTSFLHPHNGLMQVWMELGAVGVALLYATVITGARAVLARSQDIRVAAAIMGTFVSMLTIWLLSFGVWQGWWMSVLGLAAAACVYVSMTFAQDADHTGD